MTWEKLKSGDRWVLLSVPIDGVHEALGAVERIGLVYEARDRKGIVIGKRSSRDRAMRIVEEVESK